MAVEVILPKVDMDMATGKISKWLVNEGALVKQGDPLFEIETDKAAMEIESPATGYLRNVNAGEGVSVPVGEAVAFIYAEGEAAITSPTSAAAPVAPSAPAPAAPVAPAAAPQPSGYSNGVRATPLARRLARESGIDLSRVNGSGPHGRIVRSDVEQAKTAKPAAPAVSAPPPVAAPSDDAVKNLFAAGSFREIAHDKMRLTIARRLVESKSTVPHFYLTADCRLDALLNLRAELNASAPEKDGKPAWKLSINDMVIKAWALALRDVPMANVTWTGTSILAHETVDIGVAVSLEGGLITPIVRNAETKSVALISNEMKDLAARARAGKLKSSEYQGGTTAISNLGMFGVKDFAAIINPPHASILAVGAGEERGVWEKGVFVPATLMTVTLSVDHRAVDGALGAQALQAFKAYLEKPLALLV